MDSSASPPAVAPSSPSLSAFAAKLDRLKIAEQATKEMLEGRYVDVPDSERESETDRDLRIWNTPGAWS